VKIIITAATKQELPNAKYGIITGIGKKSAGKAIQKIDSADLVISVGIAGAVREGIHIGDLIIPKIIIDYNDPEHKYEIPFRIKKAGALVSVPKPFFEKEKLRIIKMCPDAIAVDMEASVIAGVLSKRNIPFLCIKAISDELDSKSKGLKQLRNNIKMAIHKYTKFLTEHFPYAMKLGSN